MSKLSDCVNILDSKRVPLSSKVRANLTKKYPYYGAQGIVDYVDDYLFDGSYILVAEDGNNLKSLNEPITTWATGKFWVNNHAHILGEKDGHCLKYIYYLLTCMDLRGYITGSAQPKFNQDNLANVKLNLPELSTQIRISDVLTVLDEKISNNNALCTELESMAKTLYDYWFTQFDFPNAEGKPYRSSGGEMVWNDQLKREIPKGWRATTMAALTTVLTGKEDANFSTPNGKYKFFTCAQETILCDTPAFSGHAVLIAGNGDFNVKHYTGDFNAYQRTYVLVPKEAKHYAVMYIAAQKRIQAFKQGSNGSIVKFITKGDVENIPIILPDNDTYLDTLNRILGKIEYCERENDELTKLRDWLLPMLMNGQATVSD